jgi:hypothetical protein
LIATAIVCDRRRRAQSNRLELGAFIAHLLRANHAGVVSLHGSIFDGSCGPGNVSIGWAMANEAKHEALMTIHPLTASLRTKVLSTKVSRTKVLATALTAFLAASGSSAAFARSIYDGAWSVLIITKSGSCDPSYRYGVEISDGNVTYQGGGPITLQGRVTPKGAVRVILQAGSQWADGSGRLKGNTGGGVWRGQGSGSTCAGVWRADRES